MNDTDLARVSFANYYSVYESSTHDNELIQD